MNGFLEYQANFRDLLSWLSLIADQGCFALFSHQLNEAATLGSVRALGPFQHQLRDKVQACPRMTIKKFVNYLVS